MGRWLRVEVITNTTGVDTDMTMFSGLDIDPTMTLATIFMGPQTMFMTTGRVVISTALTIMVMSIRAG